MYIVFQGGDSASNPSGIFDSDANLIHFDDEITDIQGKVPNPGLYVLVAQYYQPDKPEFEIPMNISYSNLGEDIDVPALIENGQFYEAILSLPTCRSNSGCRTVIQPKDKTIQPEAKFNLNDAFNIHSEVSRFGLYVTRH